jgi:hypothetical protein
MLGLDEVVDGIFGGSPWGLGLVAVAAAVAVAGPRAKPVAKGMIKGYLATTERAREWVAEASEQIQDLYAEAKHEYESELTATDAEHAEHGEPATAAEAPEPRPRRRNAPAAAGLVMPSGEPA